MTAYNTMAARALLRLACLVAVCMTSSCQSYYTDPANGLAYQQVGTKWFAYYDWAWHPTSAPPTLARKGATGAAGATRATVPWVGDFYSGPGTPKGGPVPPGGTAYWPGVEPDSIPLASKRFQTKMNLTIARLKQHYVSNVGVCGTVHEVQFMREALAKANISCHDIDESSFAEPPDTMSKSVGAYLLVHSDSIGVSMRGQPRKYF